VEQNICSLRAFFRFLLETGKVTTDFAAKTPMDFRYAFQKSFMGKVVDRMSQNEKFFMKILDDEQFANALIELMLPKVYEKLQSVEI